MAIYHRQHIKSKILLGGLESFLPHELLEALLTYSIPRKDTKELARLLINRFGGLPKVFTASMPELLEVEGMGENSACLIQIVNAILCFNAKKQAIKKTVLAGYAEILLVCHALIGNSNIENLLVIYINSQSEVMQTEILAAGTPQEVPIYPAQIIKKALNLGANGIIIAHNHPSGHIEPSQNDLALSLEVEKMCEALHLKFWDSLIIGPTSKYYSIAKERLKGNLPDFKLATK